MGVRGDVKVPVRAAVAPAPDLGSSPWSCEAGSVPASAKCERPLRRPVRDVAPGTVMAPMMHARWRSACDAAATRPGRPKIASPSEAATASGCSPGRRAAARGPRRRRPGGAGAVVRRRAPPRLSSIAQSRCQVAAFSGRSLRLGLDGGEQPELGDEAVVVGGQLAADARRERVAVQLALEQARGLLPPARALRKPREGAAGHELAGGLGDHVVVGRRAPAAERGEVLLVPVDLPYREVVVLEQVRAPGQPSSRRLIQTKLIRRIPISIPLVQFTPDRNGFSRHHDRSCRPRGRA